MAPIIEIRNVSKTYKIGYSKVQALKNVSVSIDEGEFVSLVGPSGSGKSTLLHIMGFLDRPDEGKYIFAGQETSSFSDGKLAALRANTIG
ncbi:MAG: ATP-binding cassette domain-containing protein, partial [Elusimicrobia bacterium]|nr:ATP-binding cassette domain-containing protein [Elusimicrobiota bacterium]